ncbi:MAG: HupE/UreJ family protein [Vicinamibacterales bacterium]
MARRFSVVVAQGFSLVLLLALARPAAAHPAPFSYVDLFLAADHIDATVTIHMIDLGHDLELDPLFVYNPGMVEATRERIRALIAERLFVSAGPGAGRLQPEWQGAEPLVERAALRVSLRYPLDAPTGVLRVAGAALFPYDPIHQTFLNIYEGGELRQQAILDRAPRAIEYFAGTRQGTLEVVRRFVPAGVHHILIGLDHVLFLVGLILLGGTFRRLLLIVTAFTLAHSVTLSLAALGLVNPPGRLVEPAIALSIVYIGADNLLGRGGRDVRAWIAFGFGFVHGFGFAGVLREMGLPPAALGWSLFAFNLGVELGQVLIVVAAASALAFLRSHSRRAAELVAVAGSAVVILAGTFWFVERIWRAS